MDQSTTDANDQLVHLLTYMACAPDYRNAVLDLVASYLVSAARQRGVPVSEITTDQERYVLGSLYRMLECVHAAHRQSGLPNPEADTQAVEWLSERLVEFNRL